MKDKKIHFCAPVLDWFRFGFGSERRNGGLPEPYSAETMKALDELQVGSENELFLDMYIMLTPRQTVYPAGWS